MLTTATGQAEIRPFYVGEARDLFRVLLNATSAAEAGIALRLLAEEVPERVLVAGCNLREVLAELPASPFPMRVDEQTLRAAADLEKQQLGAMSKTLPDEIELSVTTAGNLVLDVIIRDFDGSHYLSPIPIVDDRVTPAVVDLMVMSDYLLDAVLDLVQCMGVVFNPKFYVSVEDFRLENAQDAIESLGDLF